MLAVITKRLTALLVDTLGSYRLKAPSYCIQDGTGDCVIQIRRTPASTNLVRVCDEFWNPRERERNVEVRQNVDPGPDNFSEKLHFY